MSDCGQFLLGSRRRTICDGQSELPVKTVNQFRAMWGMNPLTIGADGETYTTVGSTGVVIQIVPRDPAATRASGCCGSGAPPAPPVRRMVAETGVGSRLIAMFTAAGFESCPACLDLAKRMNEWGPSGCDANLEVIVADILPRALFWERERVGWWARLLPEAVTAAAIRRIVESAISTATPLEWITDTPRQSFGSTTPLVGVPIDREKAVSHILYHIMPVAGGTEWVWRRHCQWLREVRSQYNGRLIVGIVTKGRGDHWDYFPPEAVYEELRGLDAEYVLAPNHVGHLERSGAGEGVLFPQMLERVMTDDPNHVAFYGHCKSVTRKGATRTSATYLWADAMFETLFRNQAAAIDALDSHGVCGPFRMRGGHRDGKAGIGSHWFFSGTFFATRLADAFAKNWRYIPSHYGCVEQWPRLNFDQTKQSACLFFDGVTNLYSDGYWASEVTPALEEWKAERGRPPAERAEITPSHNINEVRRSLIFHCYPKLGADWRGISMSTFRYRDVFNGRIIISITTGPDCEQPDIVAEWFRQFAQPEDINFAPNDRKAGINTTFRNQLRAIQHEPGIVFKAHTKGISHDNTDDQWRNNMAFGCLSNIPLVEQKFAEGFRTFGAFRSTSHHGATVMGQVTGPCRTSWTGWHYPGAFFWFDPKFIPESFFKLPMHHYENEAFPCHMGPIDTSFSVTKNDIHYREPIS